MGSRTPERLKPQWFQILLSVADRDRHGADIMKDVLQRTRGGMRLWPGMLYRSLGALVEAGLLSERAAPPDAEAGGGTPRYYGITDAGRSRLLDEVRLLASFVEVAAEKNLLPRPDADA